MPHDHQHAAPLPPDADGQEDLIRTQPPDEHAAPPMSKPRRCRQTRAAMRQLADSDRKSRLRCMEA